jgi:hypothetical protein
LASAPAAVSWGLNRIDCFARGADQHLWHRWCGTACPGKPGRIWVGRLHRPRPSRRGVKGSWIASRSVPTANSCTSLSPILHGATGRIWGEPSPLAQLPYSGRQTDWTASRKARTLACFISGGMAQPGATGKIRRRWERPRSTRQKACWW